MIVGDDAIQIQNDVVKGRNFIVVIDLQLSGGPDRLITDNGLTTSIPLFTP